MAPVVVLDRPISSAADPFNLSGVEVVPPGKKPADSLAKQFAHLLPTDTPCIVINTSTDFPEAVRDSLKLMSTLDLPSAKLVFNQMIFMLDKSDTVEMLCESFIKLGGCGLFYISSLADRNLSTVNTVASAIAWANLTNSSAMIVCRDSWTQMLIEPPATLKDGVWSAGRIPGLDPPSPQQPATLQTPSKHPNLDFLIDSVEPDLVDYGFTVLLRTSHSKDELHDLLRTKYFPLRKDEIEAQPDGVFKIRCSRFDDSKVEYYFKSLYWGQFHDGAEDLNKAQRSLNTELAKRAQREFMLETVNEYYSRIDKGDTNWVIDLFSENAAYVRGEVTYQGKEQIREFFQITRQIKGVHAIQSIRRDKDTVVVAGHFSGFGADGKPKEVDFCDFWTFKGREVLKRQSYLGAGAKVVEK